MNEHDDTAQDDTLVCSRCTGNCDAADSFCRYCGRALRETSLPSVPDRQTAAAVWQPPLPPTVIKGAAVVAATKLAEILLRRAARNVFQRGERGAKAAARKAKGEVITREEAAPEATDVVTETFVMRRIRIRR